MFTRRFFLGALGVTLFAPAWPAFAATPQVPSTHIYVYAMHCSICARKISRKLKSVAGVKDVSADIKKNVTYVRPHADQSPSPKDMWEAVEAAGFKPLKLVGPDGTFIKKPKR